MLSRLSSAAPGLFLLGGKHTLRSFACLPAHTHTQVRCISSTHSASAQEKAAAAAAPAEPLVGSEGFEEKFKELALRIRGHPRPGRKEVIRFLRTIQQPKDVLQSTQLIRSYVPYLPNFYKEIGGLLVNGCIRAKAFDQAIRILKDHRVYRFKPPATSILKLMNAMGEDKRPISHLLVAHRILTESDPESKLAWTPDFLYSMARNMSYQGKVLMAAKTFATFREKGTTPFASVYRLVLQKCHQHALAGTTTVEEAQAAAKMLEAGMGVDKVKDEICEKLLSEVKALKPKPAEPAAAKGEGEKTEEKEGGGTEADAKTA